MSTNYDASIKAVSYLTETLQGTGLDRANESAGAPQSYSPRQLTLGERALLRRTEDLMLVTRTRQSYPAPNPLVPTLEDDAANKELRLEAGRKAAKYVLQAAPEVIQLALDIPQLLSPFEALQFTSSAHCLQQLYLEGHGSRLSWELLDRLPSLVAAKFTDFYFPEARNSQRNFFQPRAAPVQLDLEGTFEAGALSHLTTLFNFSQLRHFFVYGNFLRPSAEGAHRVAEGELSFLLNSPLHQLEVLRLCSMPDTQRNVFSSYHPMIGLASKPVNFPRLKEMSLVKVCDDNIQSRRALAAFIMHAKAPAMTQLGLQGNGLKNGFLQFASRKYFPALQEAWFDNNLMADEHLAPLVEGSAKGLKTLCLIGNPFGYRGFFLHNMTSDEQGVKNLITDEYWSDAERHDLNFYTELFKDNRYDPSQREVYPHLHSHWEAYCFLSARAHERAEQEGNASGEGLTMVIENTTTTRPGWFGPRTSQSTRVYYR